MGLIDLLQGKVVFMDTAPFIYLIEENPTYLALVTELFQASELESFHLITSSLTLHEVLVKPFKEGNRKLADNYSRIILGSPAIKVLPFTTATSTISASIQAKYGIKTPDAIQLATAIEGGATTFLTNDRKLSVADEIEVYQLTDYLSG